MPSVARQMAVLATGALGLGCAQEGDSAGGGSRPALVAELPGGLEMEFVRIDSGVFLRGSPVTEPGRDADESPLREVRITRPFHLGRTEITQAQWEAVMGSRPWAGLDFVEEGPEYPAVNVSWDEVQGFVERLNALAGADLYRLPTEAEWEYACRGGTTTRWSFGDDPSILGDYAWHTGNTWDAGRRHAQAVATRGPNPWGLHDMHGNVNEWVADWYAADYYGQAPGADPPGPSAGEQRVYRGGYFHHNGAQRLRSANRFHAWPQARAASIGARLLRSSP